MHIFEYEFAEREDGGEICIHLLFKFLDLVLGHLILRVIEDLLAEHLENIEIILANAHVLGGGLADIVDEGTPGGVPLVLHDLHQNRVKFRQDVMHRLRQALHRAVLQDQLHHVPPQGCTLVLRQSQPLLLHQQSTTFTASSSSTSMKTFVSSVLHSSSTLGALYQK